MLNIKQDRAYFFHIVFMISYAVFLFFFDIIYYNNTLLLAVLAVISLCYVFFDLKSRQACLSTYKIDTLVLFTVINIISAVINIRYGFSDNIFCMFTFFTNYIVFYSISGYKSESLMQQLFKVVTHTMILFYTGAVLFSMLQFAADISHVRYSDIVNMRQGFIDARLFGIFSDPNYASVCCLVLAMICIYYLYKTKDRLYKWVYGICSLLFYFYVILSGSRTAVLCIIGSFAVGGYFFGYKHFYKKNWSSIKKHSVCVLTGILITCSAYGITEITQAGLSYVPMAVSYFTDDPETTAPVSLVREDVADNDDVTNNRFTIWAGAFEVFKLTPLFGTSPRNFVAYARDKLPAGYIAQTGYAVHNSIFETFVLSGFLGGGLFLLFIFSCAYHTFKHLYTKPEENFPEVFLGTVIIIVMMISALTLSMLFHNRCTYNMLFWLTMGFLTYYTCPKDRESMTLKIFNRFFGKLLKRS